MTTGKDQSQPSPGDLPDRLDSVLTVVYLVFTGGYAATSGPALLQADLSGEAIYLGRMLLDAFWDAEVQGLLALMLFHESRREARVSPDGVLVLLEDQDRLLWKRELMEEGVMLVERGLASRDFGCCTLQAAIAAVHAQARTAMDTVGKDRRPVRLITRVHSDARGGTQPRCGDRDARYAGGRDQAHRLNPRWRRTAGLLSGARGKSRPAETNRKSTRS
jgi:hypothetical protein